MFTRFTSATFRFALSIFLVGAVSGSLRTFGQDQDKDGAGLVISGNASAKDLGLPLYPGSKPHKDKDNDSPAANLGLWGGGSGFKLAIVKMESSDSSEKVEAFYKRALAKYGAVLDCSNPTAAPTNSAKDESSNAITCGNDKPDKGGVLYKSGTKQKQHIVAVQPNGSGTVFQLVNLVDWNKK